MTLAEPLVVDRRVQRRAHPGLEADRAAAGSGALDRPAVVDDRAAGRGLETDRLGIGGTKHADRVIAVAWIVPTSAPDMSWRVVSVVPARTVKLAIVDSSSSAMSVSSEVICDLA